MSTMTLEGLGMPAYRDADEVVTEATEGIERVLSDGGLRMSELTERVLRGNNRQAQQQVDVPEDAVPLAVSIMQRNGMARISEDQERLVKLTGYPAPVPVRPRNAKKQRLVDEPLPRPGRPEGVIDRDRILYSSWFHRLAGITQVIPTETGLRTHNRLTHSLKVAHVARELTAVLQARSVGEPNEGWVKDVDLDVVEASALAHDLGHPPFGHAGEVAIQDAMAKHGVSFEGNAQSFRIVTRLATGPILTHLRGLNLTRATLNGMLKYPYYKGPEPDPHVKFGAYDEDARYFKFARAGFPIGMSEPVTDEGRRQKSVEAEIMDWADDIAYAVHDLEDFYRGRVIPFAMLADSSGEQERFERSFFKRDRPVHADSAKLALSELFYVISAKLRQPFDGTRLARANLREIAIDVTARLMEGARLAPSAPTNEKPELVVIAPYERALAEVLKHLLFHYVIMRPTLSTIQHGQQYAIRALLKYYCAAAKVDPQSKAAEHLFGRLPLAQRIELRRAGRNRTERYRVIVDFVCGMTDLQAEFLARRLCGVELGSLRDTTAE